MYDEAFNVREALSITLKKLGDDHPDVATMYNNMAGVYWSRQVGSLDLKKGLEDQESKAGDEHPKTKKTMKISP